MNGPADGCNDHSVDDVGVFMFTSESVGEGHPGKLMVFEELIDKNTRQDAYNNQMTSCKILCTEIKF